jgi:hypothetical protein
LRYNFELHEETERVCEKFGVAAKEENKEVKEDK